MHMCVCKGGNNALTFHICPSADTPICIGNEITREHDLSIVFDKDAENSVFVFAGYENASFKNVHGALYAQFVFMMDRICRSISSLGRTPTNLLTNWPPLKRSIVGMF